MALRAVYEYLEQHYGNLKELEGSADGTATDLAEVVAQLQFNEQGLIPAIAQDYESGEVLMLAWMVNTRSNVRSMKALRCITPLRQNTGARAIPPDMCKNWSVCFRLRWRYSALKIAKPVRMPYDRRTCFYLNVRNSVRGLNLMINIQFHNTLSGRKETFDRLIRLSMSVVQPFTTMCTLAMVALRWYSMCLFACCKTLSEGNLRQ